MKRAFSLIIISCVSLLSLAAERNCNLWLNGVPLVADTTELKLYVTLEPHADTSLQATLQWNDSLYNKVLLDGTELDTGNQNFSLPDWSARDTHTLTICQGDETRRWQLVFTTLPIILIEANQARLYDIWKQDEDLKSPATMTVIDARARTRDARQQWVSYHTPIGIRVRGATSAGKEKKSFAVELRDENNESKNAHILGYRDDNNWILDAMFNDLSKMRNRVMTDLWNSVDDLPYKKDNDYQANGTQGEFVEVFLEGRYWGLYCLTDKIDRKKLNLKKTQDEDTPEETRRGLLWKSVFRNSATTFYDYDQSPANDTLVWEQYWEQHYPDNRQDQAWFNPIADMIDHLKANHKSKKIIEAIEQDFYLDNVIDYVIFTQAFQWMDNLQKNMYLSVRNLDKDDPARLLITPWDLDASCGRDAGGDPLTNDAKWMAFGEQLGGINNLIWHTSHYYTHDFANRLCHRWQYLKTHQLSLENVRARMMAYADAFTHSGVWDREYEVARRLRASGKPVKQAATPQEEVAFIMEFLARNYAVFDEKISKWGADPYVEPEMADANAEKAIFIVSPDTKSRHEDTETIVPGMVIKEVLADDDAITFSGDSMKIIRPDSESSHAVTDIKEVTTEARGFYPTTAFLPDAFHGTMDFDTHHSTALPTEIPQTAGDAFPIQRTLEIQYQDDQATIIGNTFGFTIQNDSAHVTITTGLEGVQYIISGASRKGSLVIHNSHPCLIRGSEGKQARLSGIKATGQLILAGTGSVSLIYDQPGDSLLNNNYTLLDSEAGITVQGGSWNFFNTAYNGKAIQASDHISIDGGLLHIISMSSGTLTDATFPKDGGLGARALYASQITVNGGQTFIKTLGHDGAAGLAATRKITINGGESYLTCYDDPVKAGDDIVVNGGLILASSLTNDAFDSKGSIHVNGGRLYAYGPDGAEGCFDNNGKTFAVTGGTIIGAAYKGDYPQAGKSTQAAFRYYKKSGLQAFVRIQGAEGQVIETLQTPAYHTMTLVYSSPLLVKGQTYTLLTSDTLDGEYAKVADVTAE